MSTRLLLAAGNHERAQRSSPSGIGNPEELKFVKLGRFTRGYYYWRLTWGWCCLTVCVCHLLCVSLTGKRTPLELDSLLVILKVKKVTPGTGTSVH